MEMQPHGYYCQWNTRAVAPQKNGHNTADRMTVFNDQTQNNQ
jgi:hypothetical protein